MHTEIGVLFNELVNTPERKATLASMIHGLTKNRFRVKLIIRGLTREWVLTPISPFDEILFVQFVESLEKREVELRCILEIIEDRYE